MPAGMLPNLARESVGMSVGDGGGLAGLDVGERRDWRVVEGRIRYNGGAMPRCFVGIK